LHRQAIAPVAAVAAERRVGASPEVVYAFLAELSNHRRMTDRYLQIKSLSSSRGGGRVVVRGPLLLRRTATTAVTTTRSPDRVAGTALIGDRTRAHVEWRIDSDRGGSRVVLRARVVEASVADRLLLRVGGRWWLRRRFDAALMRLAGALGAEQPRSSHALSPSPAASPA
jgi:hypothetical protein